MLWFVSRRTFAVRGMRSLRCADRIADKRVCPPVSGIKTTVLSGFAAKIYLLVFMVFMTLTYFDYDWLGIRLVFVVTKGGVNKLDAVDLLYSVAAVVVSEDMDFRAYAPHDLPV